MTMSTSPGELDQNTSSTQVNIYARMSDTLVDLTLSVASEAPHMLPMPAPGTHLVFQLVYHMPPSNSHDGLQNTSGRKSLRYRVEDLGSVIIGGSHTGGMQTLKPRQDNESDDDMEEADADSDADCMDQDNGMNISQKRQGESRKQRTLSDAKFVIGDRIIVAILAPRKDGSVASASSAVRDDERQRPGPMMSSRRTPRRGGRGGDMGSRDQAMPRLGDWRKGEALQERWPRAGGRERGRR